MKTLLDFFGGKVGRGVNAGTFLNEQVKRRPGNIEISSGWFDVPAIGSQRIFQLGSRDFRGFAAIVPHPAEW